MKPLRLTLRGKHGSQFKHRFILCLFDHRQEEVNDENNMVISKNKRSL